MQIHFLKTNQWATNIHKMHGYTSWLALWVKPRNFSKHNSLTTTWKMKKKRSDRTLTYTEEIHSQSCLFSSTSSPDWTLQPWYHENKQNLVASPTGNKMTQFEWVFGSSWLTNNNFFAACSHLCFSYVQDMLLMFHIFPFYRALFRSLYSPSWHSLNWRSNHSSLDPPKYLTFTSTISELNHRIWALSVKMEWVILPWLSPQRYPRDAKAKPL